MKPVQYKIKVDSSNMYIQRDINKTSIKIKAVVPELQRQASNGYLNVETLQTLGVSSPL